MRKELFRQSSLMTNRKKIKALWLSTRESVLIVFPIPVQSSLGQNFAFIRGINKYADERTPWKLAKSEDVEDRRALRTCLGVMIESLRLASALAAVMPLVHEKINDRLGLAPCVLWKEDLVWDDRLAGKNSGKRQFCFPGKSRLGSRLSTALWPQVAPPPRLPLPRGRGYRLLRE